MHTTNYASTFISVADDCAAQSGSIPPQKPVPTVARMQYEMISAKPYGYTSDDVAAAVDAKKKGVDAAELDTHRAAFFSRGQPCLRASPLAKRYGWGIHHDAESRVAIYPRESDEYARLSQDPALKQVKAMKSGR